MEDLVVALKSEVMGEAFFRYITLRFFQIVEIKQKCYGSLKFKRKQELSNIFKLIILKYQN